MKKTIITIAGHVGSGKSSTANGVAHALEYTRHSSGDFMREIAIDKGISIEELSLLAEKDTSIDKAIDAKNIEARAKEKIVIDARLAYHFIPESFKVFLTLDTKTAAKRILDHIHDEGRKGQTGTSVDELIEKTEMRYASEKKRYMDYYNLDTTDLSPFDLVIDTKTTSLDEVVREVVEAYQIWLAT